MTRFIISDIAPWFLSGMLVAVIGIIISCMPRLIRALFTVPKSIMILLIVAVAIGSYIRFAWVPNTHRIYFDEDRYLMYAVSFARTGHALGIEAATPEKVQLGDPDPGARVTVPMIHAWVMRIFGYQDSHLFTTAKILNIAQIILMFIFVLMLFERPKAALFAAWGMALVPTVVFWSVTTNLDSIFVLFGLLTAIASVWYAKHTDLRSAVFLFANFSLLLFVRIEGLLFLAVSIATITIVRRHLGRPILSKKDWGLAAAGVILLVVRAIVGLPLFTRTWCCAEATPLEIFQAGYFLRNTIPNIQTLFVQPEFPYILSILAFLALFGNQIRAHFSNASMVIHRLPIMALWLLCYFFLYSFYYAGIFYSYTFSGSYGRFFLMLVPPLLILASLMLDALTAQFSRSNNRGKTLMLGLAAVALLTLFPTVLRYRTYIRISPWDHLVDAGPRYIRTFVTEDVLTRIRPPALIIHPLTAAVLMRGISAVSLEAFITKPEAVTFVEDQLKKGIPTYIMDTSFCDQTPHKCTQIVSRFTFTPFPIENPKTPGFEVKKVLLKESNP